jgi:hypothetical protein
MSSIQGTDQFRHGAQLGPIDKETESLLTRNITLATNCTLELSKGCSFVDQILFVSDLAEQVQVTLNIQHNGDLVWMFM